MNEHCLPQGVQSRADAPGEMPLEHTPIVLNSVHIVRYYISCGLAQSGRTLFLGRQNSNCPCVTTDAAQRITTASKLCYGLWA